MEMSVTATVAEGQQMVVNVSQGTNARYQSVTVPAGIAPGQMFTFPVAAPAQPDQTAVCEEAEEPWAHPPADFDFLNALPPLPSPDLAQMRQQATTGCTLVISIVVVCVATVTVTMLIVNPEARLKWTAIGLIWTEGAVALMCLCGLLYGDPGVVRRSKTTCMPPHPEISRRVQAGEQLQNALMTNPREPVAPFRAYCVRCFVYRSSHESLKHARTVADDEAAKSSCLFCGPFKPAPQTKPAHHCSTCQRCVEHFDHHCGVFGRCIAGKGMGGNFGYFKVLIVMGNLGPLTCGLSVLISFISAYGPIGLGISAGLLMGVCACGFCCAGIATTLVMLVRMGMHTRRRAAAVSEVAVAVEEEVVEVEEVAVAVQVEGGMCK